jgi:hypothetical protein
MRTNGICIGVLAGTFLITGCSTPGPGEDAREFELFIQDGSLDSLEFEPEIGSNKQDYQIDRERVGARFAFGGESTRGFFQVFSEEFSILPNEGGGSENPELDGFGAGGGVKGTPVVSEITPDIDLIIPYRADLSLVFAEGDIGTTDQAMVYADLHLDAGVGVNWRGLRPSLGLALSSVSGVYNEEYSGGTDQDWDLSGTNVGFYVEAAYKHEDFPIYGRIRALMGDYEMTTFGIGFSF